MWYCADRSLTYNENSVLLIVIQGIRTFSFGTFRAHTNQDSFFSATLTKIEWFFQYERRSRIIFVCLAHCEIIEFFLVAYLTTLEVYNKYFGITFDYKKKIVIARRSCTSCCSTIWAHIIPKRAKKTHFRLRWKSNSAKIPKIANKTKGKMLPETQCNEALVVKGATDFSIAAIMGRQSVCMDSPDKSSSKLIVFFNFQYSYRSFWCPKWILDQMMWEFRFVTTCTELVQTHRLICWYETVFVICVSSDGIQMHWCIELFAQDSFTQSTAAAIHAIWEFRWLGKKSVQPVWKWPRYWVGVKDLAIDYRIWLLTDTHK